MLLFRTKFTFKLKVLIDKNFFRTSFRYLFKVHLIRKGVIDHKVLFHKQR